MFGLGKDKELSVRVTGDSSEMQGAMAAGEASLLSFKKAVVLTTAAVGVLGAALSAKATVDAARFNQAMADLEAVTSATAAGISKMENKIKSLGKSTKFMTQDIAGSAKVFAKAGFAAEETVAALDGVSAAAAASGESIDEVSEQLIGVVNGFNLATKATGRVADVFAQAAVETKSQINSLAKAMEYVGPVANDLGQSVEEVTAQLGILSNASIDAGRAGRQLRTAMLDFQKMEAGQFTTPAKEALDRLGISLEAIQSGKYSFQSLIEALVQAGASAGDMSTIFTKRAATALTILGKRGAELDGLVNNLENAKGAARDMAETRLDTLLQQLSVLRGSINLLMIEIGSNFTPALKGMVEGMVNAVNTMTDLVDGTKRLRDVIGPGWATVIKGITEAFKHLGVLLVSYGIGQMIAGIATAISGSGGLIAAFSGLLSSINPVIPAVIALYTAFQTLNKAVSNFEANAKDTAAAMVGMVGRTFDSIEAKKDLLQNIEVEIDRLKQLQEADRITSGQEDKLDYLESRTKILREQIEAQKERQKAEAGQDVISGVKKELKAQKQKLSKLKNQLKIYDDLSKAPRDMVSKVAATNEEIDRLEKKLERLKNAKWLGNPADWDFWNYVEDQTALSFQEGITSGTTEVDLSNWGERFKTETENAITQAFSGQIPMQFRVAGDYMKETIEGLSIKHTDAINALARDANLTTDQFIRLRQKVTDIISAQQQVIDFREQLGQDTTKLENRLQKFKDAIGWVTEESKSFEDELKDAATIAGIFGDEQDIIREKMRMLRDRISTLINKPEYTKHSQEVQKLIQRWKELKAKLEGDVNPKLKKFANMLGITVKEMEKQAKKIRSTVSTVVNGIKGIFQAAGTDIPPAMNGMLNSIQSGANAVASFMTGNWLQGSIQAGQAIASLFGGFKKQLEKQIEDMKERRQKLKDKYQNAVDLIVTSMEDLSSVINDVTSLFTGPFSSTVSGLLDGFVSMFKMTTQLNDTQALLQSGLQSIASITQGVISTFTSLIQKSDAYSKLQDEMQPLWKALGDAIADVVLPPLIALAKWMQEFFDIAKDTSSALEEVGVVASWKRKRRRFQAAQPGRTMTGGGETEVPEWARQIIEPLKNVLTPVFRELKSLPLQQIGQSIWQNIIQLATNWIPRLWNWVKQGVQWLQNNGGRIWNNVKSNILSLWNYFKNNIGPAWKTFLDEADKLMDGTTLGDIKTAINDLEDAITGAEDTAKRMGAAGAGAGLGAAGGAAAGWALGGPIGAAIGGLGGAALGGLAGWIMGGQEGLIAKKPTLAAIAEDPAGGSEAVVPLDKLEQMINMEGGSGKGNVYVFLSGRDVTETVVDEIQFKNRKNNGMSNTASALTGGY